MSVMVLYLDDLKVNLHFENSPWPVLIFNKVILNLVKYLKVHPITEWNKYWKCIPLKEMKAWPFIRPSRTLYSIFGLSIDSNLTNSCASSSFNTLRGRFFMYNFCKKKRIEEVFTTRLGLRSNCSVFVSIRFLLMKLLSVHIAPFSNEYAMKTIGVHIASAKRCC